MKRILLSFLIAIVLGLGTVTVANAQGQAEEKPMMATKKKVRKSTKKASAKGSMAAKGPHDCIDWLIKWAEKDPLIAYEGKPEDTVNNKLLWSDEKSKCYVGGDQELRNKFLKLANAWRMKDASAVRSLLQEIKSAVPQT